MVNSVSDTYVTSNVSSFGSSASVSSHASFSSSLGHTPRRGRRRYKNPIKESNKRYKAKRQDTLKTKRPAFFCTFCGNPYTTRYKWKRHEESVHVAARTWVCVPSGFYPVTCPFCLEAQPSNEHLSNHSYLGCVQKPVEERTFTHKDHLKQHIQRVHQKGGNGKLKDIEDILKEWGRQAPPLGLNSLALHCGSCGMRFREWESRVAHVAWHFIQGLDLSS
jgi:hypothetical protein